MSDSPLDVVNKRMQAYNAHDLDAFLNTYSADVAIYTYPATLLGQGLDHMRSLFAPLFEAGEVRVEIHHQIVSDSYVLNEETVHYAEEDVRYVSIYEVRGGRITSVRFVRDD